MAPAPTDPIPPRRTAAAEDAGTVRRIADGDDRALGALYDRWGRTVYAMVSALLGDRGEAEDTVEATFWQAWQTAGSYEPAQGTVRSWLLTIARNRALDRMRARAQ